MSADTPLMEYCSVIGQRDTVECYMYQHELEVNSARHVITL